MAILIDLLKAFFSALSSLVAAYADRTSQAGIQAEPAVVVGLIFVLTVMAWSGSWASSIADTRRHSGRLHFLLGLLLPGRGLAVECGFGAEVKGVMNWHDDTVATMELMYGKAYDHNDPHRARVWTCAYVLEARLQSAQ